MFVENVFRNIVIAMIDDMKGSFPSYNIEPFSNECIEHLDRLLNNFPRETSKFDMSISDSVIFLLGKMFGERFGTDPEGSLNGHIGEIKTLLILFGQLHTQDPHNLDEWCANIQAMILNYIGFYAQHTGLTTIEQQFDEMVNEAQLIAHNGDSTVH